MEKKKFIAKYLYWIFTAGLAASLAFMLAGYIYAIASGMELEVKPGYFSKSLGGIIYSIKEFSPVSLSYLGLLILNFTPTAGVIFCIFYYLKNKQYRFFFIGIAILMVLALGAVIGFLK
ncbi:MAG: DUF1634 domain-containing protein [Candidatus Humimicrobiaceae bacterium]